MHVVDGAAGEWIPVVYGVPQGGVLSRLLFILYYSEMFDRLEVECLAMQMTPPYSLFIAKHANRPAVTTYQNRVLVSIHEWCYSWCMLVKTCKAKALVVSRSRIVDPPFGKLVVGGSYTGLSKP